MRTTEGCAAPSGGGCLETVEVSQASEDRGGRRHLTQREQHEPTFGNKIIQGGRGLVGGTERSLLAGPSLCLSESRPVSGGAEWSAASSVLASVMAACLLHGHLLTAGGAQRSRCARGRQERAGTGCLAAGGQPCWGVWCAEIEGTPPPRAAHAPLDEVAHQQASVAQVTGRSVGKERFNSTPSP